MNGPFYVTHEIHKEFKLLFFRDGYDQPEDFTSERAQLVVVLREIL